MRAAFAGSVWFLQTSIQHAPRQQFRVGLLADQVITPSGAGLSARRGAGGRQMPGVASATGIIRSTIPPARE